MPGLVIVTGGSRGIGAAVSRRLAADGYAVAVNYTSDAGAALETVAAIEREGGQAQAFQADVADASSLKKLFDDATGALGPLIGLVNNAGITGPSVRVDEIDAADLTRLYAVNAVGLILACKEATLRLSTKHGGSGGTIVNISSVGARLGGLPGLVVYSTSKAAVENFTKGFATEVGPEGIRVNAIAPGMVETDMTRGPLANDAFRGHIMDMTPLRRIGTPDEVADVVAWLMSDGSRFISGSTVTVSGGI